MQAMAKTEDDMFKTQVRIPAALWERVKAAAIEQKRSANFMLVEALEAAYPAPDAKRRNRQGDAKK